MKTPRAPRLTIEVTSEIIERSRPRDSRHCMIAEALREAYPDAQKVSVDLATIRFTDPQKGLRYTYLTPRIGQEALVQFDTAVLPAPFSMALRGAMVTRAFKRATAATLSDEQRHQRSEAGKRGNAVKKARLLERNKGQGSVPDRIGGQTPPLQRTKDDVPFSRRRAYGIRALQL